MTLSPDTILHKLQPSASIFSTKPISTVICYRRVLTHSCCVCCISLMLFSQLTQLTLSPRTFHLMNPLLPAMDVSRSTSSYVVLFPHFDFLSIKRAWISSLVCLLVSFIYLSLSHALHAVASALH